MGKFSAIDFKNSGSVSFRYTEAAGSLYGTSSHIQGTFRTTRGFSGNFTSTSVGFALGKPGVSVSGGFGSSRDLSTFNGQNINLSATLGRISISDNYDPNNYEHVGQTDGLSNPGLSLGFNRSNTILTKVRGPR